MFYNPKYPRRRVAAVNSAAPAPAAAVSSLQVLGPTDLDPDGSGNGIEGNGWVVLATMPEVALATFDPQKIVITVSDPGFTGGAADTKTRTIRGGKILRRQYPNQSNPQASASGGVFTVYFTLEDDVFAGSTITGVAAEAGFYGAATAGAVSGPVNSSTLAYPKPLFAWLNIQQERATGATFAVEAAAYHRFGRNGRMVDCIEFTAKDAQASPNSSAMVRATAPALSDFQTQGQLVEAWKASLSLANLTQGDICKVNAVVKPHIGEAWDLSVEGVAWPTSQPQTLLRFKNDKASTYGGRFAYVKAGASGGAVGSSATPFPTIATALAALVTANNAAGHNDHSGSTIYLMDDGAGGAVDHTVAADLATTAGDCWTDIKVDPAATGTVRLAFISGLRAMPSLLRYFCPLVFSSTGLLYSGSLNASRMMAVEGATLTNSSSTAATPWLYGWGLGYYRNATFSGISSSAQFPLQQFSTARMNAALALGVVATGASVDLSVSAQQALIGCRLNRCKWSEIDPAVVPNADLQDGRIFANNLMTDVRAASSILQAQDTVRGCAIVQNVIERAHVGAADALEIGQSSGSETLDHRNILQVHNTFPGTGAAGSNPSRVNQMYNETAAVVGQPRKELAARFNIFYDLNMKGDAFTGTSTATGRVSNWAVRHGVGWQGNVLVLGGDNGSTTPGPDAWNGDYWEAGSKAFGATVTFTNNQAGGASAVGGGTYTLTGATNDAYTRVPSGMAALAHDMAGNARLNDGTGAAGAYERG